MAHSGGDSPPRIQRDYRLEMQAKSKRFQSLEVYENLLLTDLSYDKWENKSPGWKEMTQDGCANPQNKEPGAAGTALKEKTGGGLSPPHVKARARPRQRREGTRWHGAGHARQRTASPEFALGFMVN